MRDVLYYFHRIQATDAPYNSTEQTYPFGAMGGEMPRNNIELLAFLAESGTLEIEVGASVKDTSVAAGIHSFTVPILPGKPVFRLKRGGQTVIEVQSRFEIKISVEIQDFLY